MTHTKGNVIVEEIKVGDTHYEYDMGIGIKLKVLTLPEKNEDGAWVWKSEHVKSGKVMDYLVNPAFPSYYSVNLYDYEAYGKAKY